MIHIINQEKTIGGHMILLNSLNDKKDDLLAQLLVARPQS